MTKSAQSNLSTFIIFVVEPALEQFSIHTVPDSFSFVDKLKSLNLSQPNNFMVLFDIKSLFANVLLAEVLSICLDQLYNSDLLQPPFPRSLCNDMLCMATKNVKFSLKDFMFCQVHGVAMGSPLNLILANIFVGYDENIFISIENGRPLAYYRYVDDVIVSKQCKQLLYFAK